MQASFGGFEHGDHAFWVTDGEMTAITEENLVVTQTVSCHHPVDPAPGGIGNAFVPGDDLFIRRQGSALGFAVAVTAPEGIQISG